jgi:DNA-binding transcriptional MerR regulator
MVGKMKNTITIGQMSKLHNIPIKTLRYYDEIDLFKPIEINEETGYRYYSVEQFKQLDIIHYLKASGVPLKEIKKQLHSRNIHELLGSLKEQHSVIEEKIKEFEKMKQRLERRIYEIEYSQKIIETGVPMIHWIQKRPMVQLQEQIRTIQDLELSLRKLKHEFRLPAPIFLGKVGLTHTKTQVIQKNFLEYNSIFLLLEETEEQEILQDLITAFPEGRYASICYRGTRGESSAYYQILLNFLEENRMETNGDFIERAIVDQFISKDEQAFLTEIQVQLKE